MEESYGSILGDLCTKRCKQGTGFLGQSAPATDDSQRKGCMVRCRAEIKDDHEYILHASTYRPDKVE
jgi:hypothetical protein